MAGAARPFTRTRLATVAPESVRPAPFVTGDDLLARRVPQGPVYAQLLDELYTRQLDEVIRSREQALEALDELLAAQRFSE